MPRLCFGESSAAWVERVRVFGIASVDANVIELLLLLTATVYELTKRLLRELHVPLTLHKSLSRKLLRTKKDDPESYRRDNIPPEVGFAAATVIVLKMVYGLDGETRRGDFFLAL